MSETEEHRRRVHAAVDNLFESLKGFKDRLENQFKERDREFLALEKRMIDLEYVLKNCHIVGRYPQTDLPIPQNEKGFLALEKRVKESETETQKQEARIIILEMETVHLREGVKELEEIHAAEVKTFAKLEKVITERETP